MSLNGLDAPAVAEAHRTALQEFGGWFLVQYINRDTIELLKSGKGGVSEIRETLNEFTEKSPLYGVVQFKKKSYVLKYVPEGTSRLLQVRLTIHFQSVLDVFLPHDAVFPFSDPSELTETSLSLCPLLRPASPQTQHRLNGISEVPEEVTDTAPQPTPIEEMPPQLPDVQLEEPERESVYLETQATVDASNIQPKEEVFSYETLATQENDIPICPSATTIRARALLARYQESSAHAFSDPREISERPRPGTDYDVKDNTWLSDGAIRSESRTGLEPLEFFPAPPKYESVLSDMDTQNISQWSDQVASYTVPDSPKKKLGPRPHLTSPTRSSKSSTSIDGVSSRPVANLPTTIRVPSRISNAPVRPNSARSTQSMPTRLPSPPEELPPLPSLHIASFYKAPTKSEFSRPASINTESSTITPEKMRLMKALQMRKRTAQTTLPAAVGAEADSFPPRTSSRSSSATARQPVEVNQGVLFSQHGEKAITSKSRDQNGPEGSSHSPTSIKETSTATTSTSASSFRDSEHERGSRGSVSSSSSSSVTPRPTATIRKQDGSAVEKQASKPDRNAGATLSTIQPLNMEESFRIEPPLSTRTAQSVRDRPVEGSATFRPTERAVPGMSSANALQQSGLPATNHSELAGDQHFRNEPEFVKSHNPRKFSVASSQLTSELSENDSIMDELQYAIVEEAKSLSVARSSITPFPSQNAPSQPPKTPNAASSNHPFGAKSQITPRKLKTSSSQSSTALPSWPPPLPEKPPSPLSTKGNVGSGISRRIKALEILSNTGLSARDQQAPRSSMSSLLKRTAMFTTPSTTSENAVPAARNKTLFGKSLTSKSVPIDIQKSVSQAVESSNMPSSSHRSNVYSVTARIVRDDSQTQTEPGYFDELAPINLQQSEVTVEQKKVHERPVRPPVRDEPSQATIDTLGTLRSESTGFTRTSRRSGSRPRSSAVEGRNRRNSQASSSRRTIVHSPAETASISEDKSKESRTSRMLKRMSVLTPGARRKSRSESPVKEKESPPVIEVARAEEMVKSPTKTPNKPKAEISDLAFDIGDVNVQFPETVLWKRRFVRVDSKGNIIFSPSSYDTNFRILSKRYHLSEFRTPTLPDLEREEMAWSVLLEMKDGDYIQFACENRQARHQVLKTLVEAHAAFNQICE